MKVALFIDRKCIFRKVNPQHSHIIPENLLFYLQQISDSHGMNTLTPSGSLGALPVFELPLDRKGPFVILASASAIALVGQRSLP
jgi:hypothetical protein